MADAHLALIERDLRVTRDLFDTVLNHDGFIASVAQASECVVKTLRAGRKILLAGNGGSAADAQHIAGELVSRFNFDRAPLPAIALTTDTSILTAVGNDYGYEHIFSRQVRGLGMPGDVFIAISTSGRSPNILAGLREARCMGLATIGLMGNADCPMLDLCDISIRVPHKSTPFIQQVHITTAHIICNIVEKEIFGGPVT